MNWGVKIGKKVYYCGDREAKLLKKAGYKPTTDTELTIKASRFLSGRVLHNARKKLSLQAQGKQTILGGYL